MSKKTTISAYYCDNYDKDNVFNIVKKVLKPLGDISAIIKPNTTILIKPNLLSAYNPEYAITTHPEVVRAIIKIVKQAGAIPVIGDSPGNLSKGIEYIWEKTKLFQLAKEENVELIGFETCGCVSVAIEHPCIDKIYVSKAIINCDAIINVPKLKTHTFMGFTCGIKNFYGCIPGARKSEYHKIAPSPRDFAYILAEIYKIVKEKLLFTIVDGVCGLEGNGPSLDGTKRNYNIIAASKDTVALDTFLLNQMKIKLKNNLFLKPLKEKNLGITNLQDITYIGDDLSKFNFKKIKHPKLVENFLSFLPLWLIRFFSKHIGKLVWIKPHINKTKCVGCLQCIKYCPVQAISKKGLKPTINKSICISCFCCHELCLSKAVDLKKSLLMRLFL